MEQTEKVAGAINENPVIVHCADLHLDSPFSTFSPESSKAKRRREEQLTVFGRIIFLVRKTGASFLLIAGDLFDAARVRKDTLDYINDRFKMIPDVSICIAAGNHDPYTPDSPYATYEWNENVHIFTDNLDYFEKENVRIYGRSFSSHFARKPLIRDKEGNFPQLDNSYINILLMHGDVNNANSVYNPIYPEDLQKCGFDYAALGHIHTATEVRYAGYTPYCYCGIPEGRGFDESGERGVMLCQIGKGLSKFKFVPTAIRRYLVMRADITGCESNEDICAVILNACPQDDNIYKVILEGTLPENFRLSAGRLQTMLEYKYFYIKIKDNTKPEINLELLQQEISIRGLFVKNILAQEDISEEFRNDVLKYGLQAFDGEVSADED